MDSSVRSFRHPDPVFERAPDPPPGRDYSLRETRGGSRRPLRWVHPLRYHRFMDAICGLHLRDGPIRATAGAGDGLDAMLAALADHGEDGARWTEGAVGL